MIKVYTGTGKILMAPCSLNIVLGESIVLLRIIKYLNSYQVIKRELDYISKVKSEGGNPYGDFL